MTQLRTNLIAYINNLLIKHGRIYQYDEFDFSSTGRLGVEIGSCWRAGFSNLAKKIKWVLKTLAYALSSGNVPQYLNYRNYLKYLKILLFYF